jgi:hypothetical protein
VIERIIDTAAEQDRLCSAIQHFWPSRHFRGETYRILDDRHSAELAYAAN